MDGRMDGRKEVKRGFGWMDTREGSVDGMARTHRPADFKIPINPILLS
jgi:hypothetical protein